MPRYALRPRPQTFEESFEPTTQPVVSPAPERPVDPIFPGARSEQSSPKARNKALYVGTLAVIVPPALVLWSGHPFAAIAVFVLCGITTTLVAVAASSLDPPYLKL